MIRTNLVFGAAALAAIALPAWAQNGAVAGDPGFAAFARVCADTRADYPAVVAAAEAGGWSKSDAAGDATMAGVAVTDRLTRARRVGDSPATLFAWRGTAKGGVQVSACTVHLMKAALAGDLAAAQTWTGFAAPDASATNATFHFSDGPDGRRALAKGDYDAAAGPGLEILTISSGGRSVILDLLKIKK